MIIRIYQEKKWQESERKISDGGSRRGHMMWGRQPRTKDGFSKLEKARKHNPPESLQKEQA